MAASGAESYVDETPGGKKLELGMIFKSLNSAILMSMHVQLYGSHCALAGIRFSQNEETNFRQGLHFNFLRCY